MELLAYIGVSSLVLCGLAAIVDRLMRVEIHYGESVKPGYVRVRR